MTKLGGAIGAVLGFLFPFVVGDRIDWLADHTSTWSDTVATAIGVVFAVGGGFLGAAVVRRLKGRFVRSHTVAQ